MEIVFVGLAFFVACVFATASALVNLAIKHGRRPKPRSDRMAVGE